MAENKKNTVWISQNVNVFRWDYVKGLALIDGISPGEALDKIILFHENNAGIKGSRNNESKEGEAKQ